MKNYLIKFIILFVVMIYLSISFYVILKLNNFKIIWNYFYFILNIIPTLMFSLWSFKLSSIQSKQQDEIIDLLKQRDNLGLLKNYNRENELKDDEKLTIIKM